MTDVTKPIEPPESFVAAVLKMWPAERCATYIMGAMQHALKARGEEPRAEDHPAMLAEAARLAQHLDFRIAGMLTPAFYLELQKLPGSRSRTLRIEQEVWNLAIGVVRDFEAGVFDSPTPPAATVVDSFPASDEEGGLRTRDLKTILPQQREGATMRVVTIEHKPTGKRGHGEAPTIEEAKEQAMAQLRKAVLS